MMYKAVLPIFCMLVVGWSSAYGAPPINPRKKSLDFLCKASETALFDCEVPVASTVVSICQKDRQVFFRLGGRWRKPDLEVSSNGHDGRAYSYVGRMGSNPGGIGASFKQYTMRFIWRGLNFYSYVTIGSSNGPDSGLAIEKDDVPLVVMACKTTRHPQFTLPNFVDEEEDQKHRILY